jgi:type VI secretion system protein
LDLVIAHDDAIFSELMKVTASDYFIRKQQILRDNTGLLEVMTFEVIPGQTLPDIPINISTVNAKGAVIFANYHTQGDHRFRLGSQQKLLIRMKNLNLELDPDS